MNKGRTTLIIIALVVLALLAVGGSVGTLALAHSGFLGNIGYGYKMMGGQPGYSGMMNGQPYNGSMMGGYPQNPVQQGISVAAGTHLSMDIVMNKPGMQKDWPAFAPSNLVVPANSLVTITIRDYDLGDTPMYQGSPFTMVQGTVGTMVNADGRSYATLAADKIAHTFTIPQLNVNVPLPGDVMNSKDYNSVTFTFRTGAPGTYIFRCLDPCGTGMMGMMGPMMAQGYMIGTLTVQ